MTKSRKIFNVEVDSSTPSPKLEVLVGPIFFLLGAWAFSLWWQSNDYIQGDNIQRTKAIVLQDSLGRSSDSKTSYYLLQFDYQGQTHKVYDNDGQSGIYIYPQGDSVEVFFYKDKGPSSVRISNFVSEYVFPTMFFLLGTLFPFAGLVMFFRGIRRLFKGD